MSQTDLVQYLQMPVNASNLEKFSFLTPKVYTRVCGAICVILQLQGAAIKNARIDTIDTIDTIDCINKYEDNRYD